MVYGVGIFLVRGVVFCPFGNVEKKITSATTSHEYMTRGGVGWGSWTTYQIYGGGMGGGACPLQPARQNGDSLVVAPPQFSGHKTRAKSSCQNFGSGTMISNRFHGHAPGILIDRSYFVRELDCQHHRN